MSMFIAPPRAPNVGVTLSLNMPGGASEKDPTKPAVNGHTTQIQTLHAKTDASLLIKIDPETLEPKGLAVQKSLHPDLVGEFAAATP
jgi:torulene dioxygenase